MNDRQIACFLEAVKERNYRYAGEGIKYKAVCAFRT